MLTQLYIEYGPGKYNLLQKSTAPLDTVQSGKLVLKSGLPFMGTNSF